MGGTLLTVPRPWTRLCGLSPATSTRAIPRNRFPPRRRWKLLGAGHPEVFVQFFTVAFYFALFPATPRPMYAATLNCATKQGARTWMPRQARGNLSDPEWARLPLSSEVLAVCGPVLRRVARCHRPLRNAPKNIPRASRMEAVRSCLHNRSASTP